MIMMSGGGNVDECRKRKGTGSAVPTMRCWARLSNVGGQWYLWRYSQSVGASGEKAHKPREDHRGTGSERETANLCSAHAAHVSGHERDNNLRRIPTDCHNVAITVTPIIEVAELEQRCGNDPYSV